jgi:hypothetical protein
MGFAARINRLIPLEAPKERAETAEFSIALHDCGATFLLRFPHGPAPLLVFLPIGIESAHRATNVGALCRAAEAGPPSTRASPQTFARSSHIVDQKQMRLGILPNR